MKIKIPNNRADLKAAEQGAMISIASYLLLTTMKLSAGIIYHSSSLVADGLNNLTDVISSVAVLVGLKTAQKPADDDHRYGHWRAETIASLMTSFIMFFVGIEILRKSIEKIVTQTLDKPDINAALVALMSAAIIYGVHLYNKNLAKKSNSKGIYAVAKDNLADALTGLATAGAVFASIIGAIWLDILMAIVVAFIILKTATEIFRSNVFELSDGFNEDKLEEYKRTLERIPQVIHVKTIRGRMYGSYEYLDVTVQVDPQLSLVFAHDLTEEIEEILAIKHQIAHTHVHVEPYEEHIKK
ncbi:cation diffusion facilitator family transporter [Allofustis seminis]|uniref:cation diffusion facilitator family transporter n=1 Tax=Allofustis seminis TaxID=166939 RepID=UPI00036C4140|nr:cation diffusion facilitator family transporter [Allofustis seminis]